MNRCILLLLAVAILILIAFAAFVGFFIPGGDNLVCNGSFETGKFVNDQAEPIDDASECKVLCGGSSALDDWQVFRGLITDGQSCDSAKDAVCWFRSPNTLKIDAAIDADGDGHFAVDLTGFNGRPPEQFGSVQQDVQNTQPGEQYELSFAIGSSSRFPPPTPNPRIGISVEVVGVKNGKNSFDVPITDVSHWEQHSMTFKAVDPTTRIIFSGFGNPAPNGGNGGDFVGLDNVSIRKVCWIVNAILYGCGSQKRCPPHRKRE
jgi:hypothetical protein